MIARTDPAGTQSKPGRELTGRAVLVWIVGFFALVMVVNAVMVRAAITTFGGVDTPSSYQAGLAFKSEEQKAAEQETRHWRVNADITPVATGAALSIEIRDEAGRPVAGADVEARLAHPIDERRDVVFKIGEIGGGAYAGRAPVASGQWTLDIEISKGGERLFRSHNRVTLE